MRVHTTLIWTSLFLSAVSNTNLTGQGIKSCGHDHAQSELFDTPEDFEKAKAEVLKGAYSKYLRNSGQKNNSTITIPVVFHIIHAGETEGVGSNLPDGRVQAQLDVLNEDFSATNANYSDVTRPEWDAVKDNPLISFCLATLDPNGAATSGIVRHDIEITGTDANNNNIETVKAGIYWDTDDYMNVYVLSIPGTDASGGVVGYAFLPYFGTVGSSADGIVVDYNWFGGPGYNQTGDGTLTHEVGHYLGLFHTFNGSSCGSDDGTDDTPNINDATASLNPSLSCGNAMNPYPDGPESCGNEHMYINYMDYVNDDNCPTSFTIDQVAIMRGVLEGTAPSFATRAPLVTNASTACTGSPSCDLAAPISHTNTTCNYTDDGTATVIATDGTAPYSYAWSTNPSDSTGTVTGLSPGTYFVTTTDAAGCTVVNSSVILAAAGLDANVASTDETVRGAEDGTVSAAPSGGTPGYTYQWDSGLGTLAAYNNLIPGTYVVTVTDSLGCTTTGSGVVGQGPCVDLVVSASTEDVNCFDGFDGQAMVSVSGGVGPYIYRWNGQVFGNERINLTAQSYSVEVIDNEGCSGSISFTITEPSELNSSLSTTGITGVGINDGTATVNISGGTVPYTYAWSDGGGNTKNRSNLSPGIYTVTITDANNCSAGTSGEVDDYDCSDFDITLAGGELLCAGDISFISVSNVSSNGPFIYTWNTGETTDAIEVSSSGTYTVSIQDANGCVSAESKEIHDAPDGIGLSFASFAESATDANDGRIETQVDGGTPTYTFLWSNGATTANLNNLTPGSYSITVTDSNNCSETAFVTINEFTCSPFQIVMNTLDVSCFDGADGSIVAAPFGKAPYSYNWSNGATVSAVDLLSADTYSLTVIDGNGCSSTASATVNQPTEINIEINKFDESALGANDGEILTTVSGGLPGYTFLWSDGSIEANRTGLAPGGYGLTVTDNTLCTNTVVLNISEYSCGDIMIAPQVTNISCSGDTTGAIELNIEQINAPYTVLWSTGSIAESVSGLAAGTYTVTLTDGGGCELLRTLTLTESSPLSGITTATAETAYESNDGTISIIANGGMAPYTYAWSTGTSTADISDLSGGAYTVTVADANGCSYTETVNVAAYVCPSFDIVNFNKTDNLCSGEAHGILGASIQGGTAPYAFNWSNGATSAILDGLEAGTYSLTVTDSKNCPTIGIASVVEPSELVAIAAISHVSGVGLADGSASLAIQGGATPYVIDWSNGTSHVSIENLSVGSYSYTITDNNGCQIVEDITIEQYVCPDLTIAFETTNITCNGAQDGELRAFASEGTAPYFYLWPNGSTDESITGLSTGNYEVSATDAKGCSIVGTDSITEPTPLSYTMNVIDESGGNAHDGAILLSITGGAESYEVTWTDGGTGAERTQLPPGIYGFVILDVNRCSVSGEARIIEFDCPEITLSIDVYNNECRDGDEGGVDIVVNNGTAPYTYSVDSVLYDDVSIRGIVAGSHQLVVADANGCSASTSFEVETPMAMTINELTTEDTNGILPGAAIIGVVGGTEPYSYLWSDGRTDANNSALFPGIHQVSITDALDCVIVQDVIIYQLEDANSLEDLELFETHPNPASEMINIQVEFSLAKDIRVVITNLSGQPVFDEVLNTQVYNKEVDISAFPKGLYSINIYSAEEVITKSLAIF